MHSSATAGASQYKTKLEVLCSFKQEIVFKKDKATLHVISKSCEDTVNYSN